MADLAEYLSDQYELPEEPEQRQKFVIDDDDRANWALRKLAIHKQERERINAQAEAEINRVANWATEAMKPIDDSVAFLEGMLESYFRNLRKDGYDKASYKLPAGTLKRSAGRASIEIENEEALLEWVKENHPEWVHTKISEAVPKSVLAKEMRDGKIVTEDGEVVPGVAVVEPRETYKAIPFTETETTTNATEEEG